MKEQRQNTASASKCSAEEGELISRARTGDGRAFEQLIEPYTQRIYNIGLRMLGNREDAADMTQETLIKAYRNLPRFRGDSAFFSWLYQIAVNTCRDFLRMSYRSREFSFSETDRDDERSVFEVPDYSQLPERLYTEKEVNEYLQLLIRGLGPRYRMTVALREIAGLPYADIARVTGVSIGTVKSRLSRARGAMQQQVLADAEHYPELLRLTGKGGANDEM